jgi:hypothetical protein
MTGRDSLDKQPELRDIDMRFGMWNVKSVYMAHSLMTVAKEISQSQLYLVGA